MVGALLSGMGFDRNLAPTADQSESAVRAMWIGFLWIPVASQLLTLVLMQFYRLKATDFGAAAGPEPKMAGEISPADARG